MIIFLDRVLDMDSRQLSHLPFLAHRSFPYLFNGSQTRRNGRGIGRKKVVHK